MSTLTFFFLFVCILAILFLVINLLLAPHNAYSEKLSAFECGFHSFSQTRLPFTISFFIYGLVFLLFDLEILLLFPYAASSYENNLYGLILMLLFSIMVTVGFIFELGKGALKISNKQLDNFTFNKKPSNQIYSIGRLSSSQNISKFNQKRYYSTERLTSDSMNP
jgi:NADH-ubiquinone oxidoreductase chain 3